jgi:ribonuclease P protein component
MLPRTERLSTEEFMLVIEKGRVLHSPLFLVRVLPGKNARFAAVAPQKIAKTSVMRHKIRRQIYAAIQELKKSASFSPAQVLIIAKDAIHTSTPGDRSSSLKEVFVKAGIIK